MINRVYMVVERRYHKTGMVPAVELDVLGVFSSKRKSIEFIRLALEDDNSGIERDTLLDIWIENVDEYFGVTEIIDTRDASKWVSIEDDNNFQYIDWI